MRRFGFFVRRPIPRLEHWRYEAAQLILNTRKAKRLLLVLKFYSDDLNSSVKLDKLSHFGKRLDPTSLEKDTGKMLPE